MAQLPFWDSLPESELNRLELLAVAAERQAMEGGKDWPGKPCRQRLDLFLALTPQVTLQLLTLARRGLRAETLS